MAKQRKGYDRNKVKLEELKINKREEYIKQAEERLLNNNEIYEKNEKELIPEKERLLKKAKRFFEMEERKNKIKLSGTKIVRATFEFEQTKEWEDWNKEMVEDALKELYENRDKELKKIEDEIEKLKEQQNRILVENPKVEKRLNQMKNGEIEISDEEAISSMDAIAS